jgi:hypothetical protein
MLSDRALICSSALNEVDSKGLIGSQKDFWGNLYTQGFRMVITDNTTHKDIPVNAINFIRNNENYEIKSLKYSSNLTMHTIVDKNGLKAEKKERC